MRLSRRSCRAAAVIALLAAGPRLAAAATQVITYHYDNLRTGWNHTETQLTPSTVASSSFGLLAQVPLDEQVDGQPLYMPGLTIAGAVHNTVFVVTENNTAYAIDADTGAILLTNHMAAPVPFGVSPNGCNTNSDNLGVESTPVIDPATNTLYVMAYTLADNHEAYFLHALNLLTLADTVAPVLVSAQGTTSSGGVIKFNSSAQRQRPALLETGGAIYAAFGSHCDGHGATSRGWVLGWKAGSLTPLPANQMVNRNASSPSGVFLTSIWMSGYGLASDDNGSLFFATANSDAQSYNPQTNPDESVVSLSADLTTVQSYFTPANQPELDEDDQDFGSGGVLLLPTQTVGQPHLAVAAGKTGSLYLLNRDALGGFGAVAPAVQAYPNGGCWCGQTYFTGSNGAGFVVTSTGHTADLYQLVPGTPATLTLQAATHTLTTGQAGGFFTTVSSNATHAKSAVVWALLRPTKTSTTYPVVLAAFNPAASMKQILSTTAGTWPFAAQGANANLVPVVADGHVFVASFQQLSIFGLAPPAQHIAFKAPPAPHFAVYTGTPHDITGIVLSRGFARLTLRSRTGAIVSVDLTPARRTQDVANVGLGHAALVRGDYTGPGRFTARYVLEAKDSPDFWGPDR